MGAITPLGLNADEFWQGLVEGKTGIGPITHFDASAYPVKIAGEVKNFDPANFMDIKRVDRTGEPLSMLLMDLDDFKRLNDRHGHAAGDEVLMNIAGRLNENIRESDLLARYGGEEFALLAIDTELSGAIALGEKIRQAVEEADFVTDVPSEKEQLTVSVGVAIFGGDRRQFFADADAALYDAKDAGRNRVVVASPRSDGSQIEDSDDAD